MNQTKRTNKSKHVYQSHINGHFSESKDLTWEVCGESKLIFLNLRKEKLDKAGTELEDERNRRLSKSVKKSA